MINLFEPSVGTAELGAVEAVFKSSWLGMGDRVGRFEAAFAEYIGRPAHEVYAVSSCTEGLFHAVAALDLGPDDEVILPTISFIGAAHAVRSAGARIALCDVDPRSLNPTREHVERAVTDRTRAVVILHYGGAPGAVAEIAEFAEQRGLVLLEDAAVGLGSFAAGRACGTFGDVGVWSFDSMKVVTTADGGMVWCRSETTADRVRRSTRLGVGSSGFDRRRASGRWWELDPRAIGRRGNMNDVAAAIGLVQLSRLPDFLRRRGEIAAAYDEALADLPWLALAREGAGAAIFYWVQTEPGARDSLAAYLLEHGIYTNFQYWPLHRMRMYACGRSFPGADRAAASTLLLPLHQSLTDRDVEEVVSAVRAFTPPAGQ